MPRGNTYIEGPVDKLVQIATVKGNLIVVNEEAIAEIFKGFEDQISILHKKLAQLSMGASERGLLKKAEKLFSQGMNRYQREKYTKAIDEFERAKAIYVKLNMLPELARAVRNMPPQYFVMISKTGALGLGEFPYPEWHKQEKENVLSKVGIKVEHGEPTFEGEYKGTFRTVGDKEHAEIVRLYIEEELGFNKIAEVLGRSSRTPLTQIQKHNRAVERSEFCPSCRRFRSGYESRIARK